MLTINPVLAEKISIPQLFLKKEQTPRKRLSIGSLCLCCLQCCLIGPLNLFRHKFLPFLKYASFQQSKHQSVCDFEKVDVLQCKISSEKINELLAHRQICAADIHCIDTYSKRRLRELCLKTCLYSSVRHRQKNKGRN